MSHHLWGIALAVGLGVSCVATPTSATPVLDQSNAYDPGFTGSAVVTAHSLAQTFTVGLSGLLRRVDLQLYKSTGTVGDLTFDIRN